MEGTQAFAATVCGTKNALIVSEEIEEVVRPVDCRVDDWWQSSPEFANVKIATGNVFFIGAPLPKEFGLKKESSKSH